MKRLFVAGALSLVMAGCAQSRSALTQDDSKQKPNPVALTPIPSIYDSVNTGMGDKAVVQTAIKDPGDPRWAGRAQVPYAPRSSGAGLASAERRPAKSPAASSSPPNEMPLATAPPATSSSPNETPLATAAPATSSSPNETPLATAAPATSSSPNETPLAAAAPAPVSAGPNKGTAIPPAHPDTITSAGANDAATADLSRSPEGSVPAQDAPRAAARSLAPESAGAHAAADRPSGLRDREAASHEAVNVPPDATGLSAPSQPTVPSVPELPESAPRRGGDPLLGPNPDLMPSMIDLPPAKRPETTAPGSRNKDAGANPPSSAGARPAAAPASAAASAPVADLPPLPEPKPATPSAPSPAAGAVELESAPGPALEPIKGPALPPATSPGPSGTGGSARAPAAASSSEKLAAELPPESSAAVTLRRAARRDDHLVQTSYEEPAALPKQQKHDWKRAGWPVARVGDEIITFHDLVIAIRETIQRYPELRARANFDSAEQLMKRKQIDVLSRQVLNELIERSMVVQEAKRHLKDPKQLERVSDLANKLWTEEQLPPMMRAYHVESQERLKEFLAEHGRSLESVRRSFSQTFLAESFLHEKLKDKVSVDLPDLLKYYNAHVNNHEFDRPAQTTWRELVVEVRKHRTREAARRKADDLVSQLKRGADFAQLAQTQSDGAQSARREGGLMRTTPGGYAVAAVNDALNSLPIGQTSGVLEGSDSFHIVRVENRRAAGPATFEEVQDKILPMLVDRKRAAERAAYLAKLRRKTFISTIYDSGSHDPNRLAAAK
jgi:peptidyl-prolyl cis-trans isomerase SurA